MQTLHQRPLTGPFFQAWAIPTTDAARGAIADLACGERDPAGAPGAFLPIAVTGWVLSIDKLQTGMTFTYKSGAKLASRN